MCDHAPMNMSGGIALVGPGNRLALRSPNFQRVMAFAVGLALIACMGRVPELLRARPQSSATKSAVPAVPARSTLAPDLSSISERATHQLSPVTGRPGVLEVSESGYQARFGPDGFTYTPAGASTALGVSLDAMRRGREGTGAHARSLGGRGERGNTGRRPWDGRAGDGARRAAGVGLRTRTHAGGPG